MSKAAKQSIYILIILLVLSIAFAGINVVGKQKAEKESSMLSAEIKVAKEKIKIGENEIARLNREIENQIEKANNEKKDLRNEIDKANAKTDDTLAELSSVKDDRNRWQSRVDSIKEERDNLMTTIKSHKAEVDKLSQEISSLKNEKKDMLKKLAEKPEPQIIYRDREPEPSSGYQEQAVETTPRPSPVVNMPEGSTQNEEYWAGVLREKMELEMKIEDLEKKISDDSIEIVDLKQKNDSLKIKMEILEKDKEAIDRSIAKKEAQLQELLTQKEKSLQKAIVDSAKERSRQEEMLNNLSLQLAKSKNENSAIEQKASTFEKENQELRKQIDRLVSTKGAIEKSLLKMAQDKKEVQKQLDQSDGLIQNKIDEIWAVKDSIDKVLDVASSRRVQDISKPNEVELAPIVVSSSASGVLPEVEKNIEAEKDIAVKKVKIEQGNIVSVNETNNFVIIDLGSSSGIEIGDAFNVFHNSKYIGRVEVIQVRDDISAADIKDKISQINIGDIVKK